VFQVGEGRGGSPIWKWLAVVVFVAIVGAVPICGF